MSASLVGSEMCIRDRLPLPGCHGDHRPQSSTAAPSRPSSESRGGGDEPVSYTHLTLPTICSV
eukprot:5395603-Alexandrium_andersonii.AAC.1